MKIPLQVLNENGQHFAAITRQQVHIPTNLFHAELSVFDAYKIVLKN